MEYKNNKNNECLVYLIICIVNEEENKKKRSFLKIRGSLVVSIWTIRCVLWESIPIIIVTTNGFNNPGSAKLVLCPPGERHIRVHSFIVTTIGEFFTLKSNCELKKKIYYFALSSVGKDFNGT